jgi:glycosyltransferase involved in cell wall biosynthesis
LTVLQTHSESHGDDAARTEAGKQSLTVVIPVLNEASGLTALEDRLRAALERLGRSWDVIFIDDGSTDATLHTLRALHARDPRFKAVSLSRNFGKEIAVAAGLRFASGDAAVVMDGDLQHPPELIAEFVAQWDRGFDIVYGQRTDRQTDTALHRWAARTFYKLFRSVSGTELPDGAGDFRLIDRKAIDVLNRMGERARFNKGLYAWIGFKSIGVPYDVQMRSAGQSRWRPRQLLQFALDGLASFTTMPLRIWSYLGLLVAAFALFYSLVFLITTLLYGIDVPGFPSLIVSVMFFAGVQLISLGVIGEYLGRVYEEVKGRPLFIVAETVGDLTTPVLEKPPAGAKGTEK